MDTFGGYFGSVLGMSLTGAAGEDGGDRQGQQQDPPATSPTNECETCEEDIDDYLRVQPLPSTCGLVYSAPTITQDEEGHDGTQG